MKVGKISERVLTRSVLRQIKGKNKDVLSGAGIGGDCAVFEHKSVYFAGSVQASVLSAPTDIRYTIIKAVNSVACGGAKPVMILLTILLPETAEECELGQIMREAESTAQQLKIQIAGGHTEVSAAVLKPCVTVTACGTPEDFAVLPGRAAPGQDVVISKWIGLEGTAILALSEKDGLAERYPLSMMEEAAAFDRYLSIIPEAAIAVKSNVSAIHDVSGGGIFAALWELAESAGVGLGIDLKKIPIKQETIEICEFFGLNPYELLSGGCLLMTAEDGPKLAQALQAEHIPAVVIGKITDDNDRVIINEDERRFLERPNTDEIIKNRKETL